MDNNANNNQIRKISAGGRDSTLLYQNINSNINIDSGKQKDEKKEDIVYSLKTWQNLLNQKNIKVLKNEKRKNQQKNKKKRIQKN